MTTLRLLKPCCVLKDTGSIYLHCDTMASHCLKILMDGVWHFRDSAKARKAGVYKYNNLREIPRLQIVSVADLFKEYLPLQLPPEEVRNGRKMTVIAEPGADEAKGGLFGE